MLKLLPTDGSNVVKTVFAPLCSAAHSEAQRHAAGIGLIRTLALTSVLTLAGCHTQTLSDHTRSLAPFGLSDTQPLNPAPGQAQDDFTQLAPPTDWLKSFNDPLLSQWVSLATEQNFDVLEARARVDAALQARRVAGSGLWPTLGLGVDGQRQKNHTALNTGPGETITTRYGNHFAASLDVSWEVDLWGKLGDGLDAADYRWQAEAALYTSSRLSIAGQVAKAWYNLATQHLLTTLYEQRVHNLSTNLDIIQSGYRQGINGALDVYLARTDLLQEERNLTQQQEFETEATRQLQLLLGQYPSGTLSDLDAHHWTLPEPGQLDAEALNAQTVRHRYDLQASFLELLACDKDVAAAYKARFPSFRLTASTGDTSDEFHNLFDASSLAWNLLGNLTQPLLEGGRLQAREQQQRALVRQKEQQYLKTLYTAFSEVGQAITTESSLKQQLEQVRHAKELAEAAEQLAFEEYRQGLQDYSSVLEAQRRAFMTQNTWVNLRNQLLQNRVNLYLALGGDYQ